MKERLILVGRLIAAILAVFLLAACPPEPDPEYTVSFYAGTGSGKPPASQTVKKGKSITLSKQGDMTAPSGKTFAGWKIGGGSTIYKPEDSVKITADTMFTAQWGYIASFGVGEGSGSAPASQTVTGASVTLPGKGDMRAPFGKTFAGWKIGGGSTIYEPEDSVTITADTVFTAQWYTPGTYIASFHVGEGSGSAPESQTVAYTYSGYYDRYVASVTLPGKGDMTAPSGKAFAGWKIDGGSTIYKAGEIVKITANTVFIAQWYTPTYYTVSFGVGKGGGSAPESKTVIDGSSVTLPGKGDMTAPSGEAFAGWKSSSDSTIYEAGASVTIAGNTVFTAQWSDTITETGKTYVLFRNTEEFAVSIYKESTRLTEIALVPAEGTKRIESDAAPNGATFYPQFHFTVDGLQVFTQDEPGIVARIDANTVNEVTVPRLGAVTVDMACIRIENQSSSSLTLNRDGYELRPVGATSSILMPQEQGLYAVQAGGVSGYAVMRNTTEAIALQAIVSEFEGGIVYTFSYNGTSLAFTSAKDMWGNWTDPPSSFTVSTAADMQAALDWIGGSTDASAQFVINIAESFSLGSTSIDAALTLMSSGGEKTISVNGAGSLFTVESGGALTLGNNVTLRGMSGNTASLVQVNSGGSLEMTAGSKISGNTNTSSSGGGVYVSGGTFTMSGGEISGNTASKYGGGVYVGSSGTFTMIGGTISGNTASSSYSGGGVCVYSGTFTMSGGAISGNTASNYGGGVYVYTGTFTKETGGVIYGSDADASLRNTAYSSTYGHAVYVYSSSKKRNTTAGEGVTLDSGSSDGWE
ncbi:MAG: InlB B-repeat-containing protein [Treponema sp.]|jgi:hypothetical protein|nr:InlB B-repeat-containing protein [Treponema sp.]